ncbi:MAG: Hsp33 family molecular chaperone HslO [Bacillales bacterium]|jgi:molecular chaperone Hsp33|nr:Hsp33 family molecular chaperone HslO [Bacillales bacterium]
MIIRGTLKEHKLRFVFVDNKDIVIKANRQHNFSPVATYIASQLLSITSILSFLEKDDTTSLMVAIKGDGPLGNFKTFALANNIVINGVEKLSENISSFNDLLGKGKIEVIKTIFDTNFVSSIELETGSLSKEFSSFFLQSEQIPTVVCLQPLFNEYGELLQSYGLIVQGLPDMQDNDLFFLEDLANDLNETKYNGDLNLFFEQLKIVPENSEREDLIYKCSCNKKQIVSTLKMLDEGEEPFFEVTCEKCGKVYLVNKKEVCGK